MVDFIINRIFLSADDSAFIKIDDSLSSVNTLKSISPIPNGKAKTYTTICNIATIDYSDDITRRNRRNINKYICHNINKNKAHNKGEIIQDIGLKRSNFKEMYYYTKGEDKRPHYESRIEGTKVVSKKKQHLQLEKICDISTVTNDYWSRIVNRKILKYLKNHRRGRKEGKLLLITKL